MIQLKSAKQMRSSIERACRSRLLVRLTSIRGMYRVLNRQNNHEYTVNFFRRKIDGKRFGGCTCRAGQENQICKHLAAAAGVHVGLSAMRRGLRFVR
jgi:hypothetical protein